jgi:hypothetical protein
VTIISILLLFVRSSELSKESVHTVLDSIDKALLEKDANAVIVNYASNAVITATIVDHGRKDKTHYKTSKAYGDVLKNSFDAYSDYKIMRTNQTIKISFSGKTAEVTATIIEAFTLGGNAERSVTQESVTLEAINGKFLVIQEHDDVKVD